MSDSKTIITSSDVSRPARFKQAEACLVEIYGSDLGKRFTFASNALIIGRDESCDIVLAQDNVSRYHAKLVLFHDDTVEIEDLKSTNGTFVNDEDLLEPKTLHNGDLIRVGSTIFKYISGSNIEAGYYEEIYRMTIIDGLTGIYNKRYFMESLTKEIGRSQRYERPLALIMMDIDHFKNVNDTFGHIAGDFVLRYMCQTISKFVRQEEVFARYGGEEFAIMLPERTIEKAALFAEKVRKQVESTNFTFEGEKLPITLSLGIAQLGNEKTPEDFIAAADAFLYLAKNNGRNQVQHA